MFGYILGIIFVCIILGVIFGCLTKSLYEKKGYDGGFVLGFFLWLIGLIYAIGLPDKTKYKIYIKKNSKDMYELIYYKVNFDNETEDDKEYVDNEIKLQQENNKTTLVTNVDISEEIGEKYCVKCGALLCDENGLKCSACGNKTYICPECGFQVFPDEEKCSNCGAKRI